MGCTVVCVLRVFSHVSAHRGVALVFLVLPMPLLRRPPLSLFPSRSPGRRAAAVAVAVAVAGAAPSPLFG